MKDSSGPDLTRTKLSEEFARLAQICSGKDVTLAALLKALRTRGHALMTLFFAFPFLLPIPMPGLSVLFGLIIMGAGIAIALGQKPWLPRSWLRRPVPSRILLPLFKAAEKILSKVERVVKPRGKFFSTHPWTHSLTGIMISVCGFLLALPLPPGTNFPPATAIAFLSIGVLEEDGVFLALGYFFFTLNCLFFTLLVLLGVEGVRRLLHF